METIHLRTPEFEVSNVVYNHKFNFNVEMMRYILIKRKLTMPKGFRMLEEAFVNFYESINLDNLEKVEDPFLFKLHKSRYPEVEVKEYNRVVEEIWNDSGVNSQAISRANLRVNITTESDNKSTIFELFEKGKRVFHRRVFNSGINSRVRTNSKLNSELSYRMLAALLRYDLLGYLNNSSAAVAPEVYSKLQKQGYNVELFASFYNVYMDYYFGLFYDLEHPFGCLGNLFTAQINYGKFVCNPPFNVHIMNRLAKFLKRQAELSESDSPVSPFSPEKVDSKPKISVYVTVPVWYKKDREKLGKFDTYSEKSEFHKEILEPYIVHDELISQKDYKFYSYLTGKYGNLCDVNNFRVIF